MSDAIKVFEGFRGSTALITGGMGFIGSNLARKLVELGANVTLVDSLIPEYGGNRRNIADIAEQVDVNIADVRDPHSMQHLVQNKDYLFNLAGQTSHLDSMLDPHTDLQINCTAQLSILEACRAVNPQIRIVFASTRQLYGKPDYLPVDEKHPLRPVDVNGINKMAGEWYHILYNNVHNIQTAAIRLTNTYGPGMRIKDARQTFLGIWIKLLLENQPFEVWDGSQLRDFTFVDDAVSALLLATHKDAAGKVFNLGGDPTVSLNELAEMLVDVAGEGWFEQKTFPADRKRIDIGNYYADDTLIRNTLGWQPTVSLKEGLKQTVAYYRENLAHYV